MKNVIGFRRGKIFLTEGAVPAGDILAMTVISELMQFGYVADESARKAFSLASKEDLAQFHSEVLSYLKDITGSGRNYKPFWPGFPSQVMEMSEAMLWAHQIYHYLSNGTYLPDEWTKTRAVAFEQPSYTTYSAGTEDDFLNIFRDMVAVNQSLSPQDMREVKWYAENVSNLRLPEVVPFKETLSVLASLGVKVPVRTVTDVLRVAVALSGGDTSLPKVPRKLVKLNRWSSSLSQNPEREKFKFKKFSRPERRYILELLESTPCNTDEAVLKDGRWIRLGEIIHPKQYTNLYPKAAKMFDQIRNEKIQSWYGKLNQSFQKSLIDGLKVLAGRPGEFMRRLDWLVRTFSQDSDLILEFQNKIAGRVSNKVLLENYYHFEGRTKPKTNRSIMVKGARSRTKLPDLPKIAENVVLDIQNSIKRSLQSKFSALSPLGTVWIDEDLRNIPLPTNMRSMNDALRPTVRGQRTPIGNQDAKVIRAYVHWFDEYGKEDLDLSATFLGMGKTSTISWNQYHNHEQLGCHSGDVRHVQGACAEYVDIKVDTALKAGYKYVIMDVRNYNGRGLDTMKECVFGYMERENAVAGEIFKPATLANSTKLQSTSTTTLVAVIDLETREYIFLDVDQAGIPVASANTEAILEAIQPYTTEPKFSVYHLLRMHAEARGQLVGNKEEAETKFEYAPFAESYVETLKMIGN